MPDDQDETSPAGVMYPTSKGSTLAPMTGRGQVVVLWDPEYPPPPDSLLDAASTATSGWDWSHYGPDDLPDDLSARLASADVVIGVPTLWTLEHVVEARARFVAVVLGPVPDHIADGHSLVEGHESVVEGWPAASQWSSVLDDAIALDREHQESIHESSMVEVVAEDLRDLLAEIRTRYLPSVLRER